MMHHVRIVAAILRKDVIGLLPLVLLAVAVFFVTPLVANLQIDPDQEAWRTLQANFYWLGFFLALLLMTSAVQLDPADSLDHDWLTRPVSRSDWLLAKLLFPVVTVWIPVVLTRFIVNLGQGYGLGHTLTYALAVENPVALVPVPLLFAAALLTANLRKFIFVIVIVFLMILLPAWDLTRPLARLLGIAGSSDVGGMIWLQAFPALLAGIGAALGVYWFLYCRRRRGPAIRAFAVGAGLLFFTLFTPTWLFGWDQAIAIHRWLLNEPDSPLERAVQLERVPACFPAADVDEGGRSASTNPLVVQAGLYDEVLNRAGPGAMLLATPVRARDTLAEWVQLQQSGRRENIDWLVDRVRVQGRYVADSLPEGVELIRSFGALNRFAPPSAMDTDYWLVSGDAVGALAADPTTRLELDYDLGLLAPTSYAIATDGKRYDFPMLGSCRAELDPDANRIEVDCVKSGPQPAMVAAQLIGIPQSRVDSTVRPTYKARWLSAISHKRYVLSLEHASLVDSESILLTAYTPRYLVHQRLVSPGVLGDVRERCPLPNSEQYAAVERSTWSDKSPHEISSVAVERGVRVEVLDWRGDNPPAAPTLLLLHGLGATAHSYDGLAPKLAQDYPVVAMTRRGVGDSSKPDHGYDIARLGQDVLEVIATLGIEKPVLVGHSIGGEELSYLGAHFPERFSGLVYLDAAYDRTVPLNVENWQLNRSLPERPGPRPSETTSYAALDRYARRLGSARGIGIPEGEIIASYDLETGAVKHNSLYLDAMTAGLQAPDYAHIPIPALGIFATPGSPESMMEFWYDRDDPQIRATVAKLFALQEEFRRQQIEYFRNGIANATVLELKDADHWIFVSNEQDVLDAIGSFVAGLR